MPQISSLAKGQELIARLDFSPDEVDALKAKLLELTRAKVVVRVGRTLAGGIEYGERDDLGIQLAATVKALEFAVGKPKQMLEVSRAPGSGQNPNNAQNLGQLLARNPEIASRVINALKDGLAIAQAIDVSPASASQAPRPPE